MLCDLWDRISQSVPLTLGWLTRAIYKRRARAVSGVQQNSVYWFSYWMWRLTGGSPCLLVSFRTLTHMLQCSVSTLHSTASPGKKSPTAEVTHCVSGSQVNTVSVKQAPKVDGENMHLIHEKEVPQLHSVANPIITTVVLITTSECLCLSLKLPLVFIHFDMFIAQIQTTRQRHGKYYLAVTVLGFLHCACWCSITA